MNSPEEFKHGHMRYALVKIPRTKYNNWKCCAAKILMGLWGGVVMLKVSRQLEVTLRAFVTSKWHLCGY